jgi:hypothetical protein
VRTFATLQVLCTFDLDQVQDAFNQQTTFDDTDASTSSTVQSGLVTLAPGATSQQFVFGGVTAASTLLVLAYDAVKVQLGSNSAPLVGVVPVPASGASAVSSVYQRQSQPGILFLRGKVSSLYLTNPSSTASARVFVAVVGEAL